MNAENGPIRILVVDDDPPNADLIRRVLAHAGYQPVIARTADHALELAAIQRFELVVSDIAMPAIDGWTLMRELHQRHRMRGIAVSGLAYDGDRQASRAAGFAAHLAKPFEIHALLETVEYVLRSPPEPADERIRRPP